MRYEANASETVWCTEKENSAPHEHAHQRRGPASMSRAAAGRAPAVRTTQRAEMKSRAQALGVPIGYVLKWRESFGR